MRRAVLAAVVIPLLFSAGCSDDDGLSPDAGQKPDGQQQNEASVPDIPEVCEELLPERFPEDTVLERGCYLCQKTPIISAGVTLTMEPGVKIVFYPGTGLRLTADQNLIADGSAAAPIIFTGSQKQRGHWNGVHLDGTLQPDSTLDYVTIEYAGNTDADSDAAAVKMTSDSRGVRLSITNTTLRESQGWGLWAGGTALIGAFSNNTLTGNTLGPAALASEVVSVLDAASTFQGNDRDELVVNAHNAEGSWAALDVPYFIDGRLFVEGDLTIAPGVTLIMSEGGDINISGDDNALIAAGTADRPILFTGAIKERGFWEGIIFDGSNNTRNKLAHVIVEYAGDPSAVSDMAAVRLTGDSHGVQLSMTETTLQESGAWGLYLTGSAVLPGFSGNNLTKNTLGPVSVGSEAVHQLLPASSYSGNDVDHVVVRDGYVSQTVTWAALDAPYLIKNSIRPNHAALTLAPGVTLIMDAGAYINTDGDDSWLRAVGTAAAPITITGLTKTAGFWESIVFGNTRQNPNALEHCTIEYGGGGAYKGWQGMIVASSDSRGVALSLANSTVQHSAVYGLWQGLYANVNLSGTTFANCASGDIFQQQ